MSRRVLTLVLAVIAAQISIAHHALAADAVRVRFLAGR